MNDDISKKLYDYFHHPDLQIKCLKCNKDVFYMMINENELCIYCQPSISSLFNNKKTKKNNNKKNKMKRRRRKNK